ALVRIGKHEFIAEVADTEEERARGLSGRDSLDEMRGMLFLFDSPAGGPEVQSFWMKDMKFPIDIIWVRKGGVIGADRNLPLPVSGAALSGLPMYVSPGPVNAVLEVRAGTVEALEIRAGDKFSF
ncbi:MAG: DUF192 domain-containing protein, partial [Nanoarchaeota archaeon]|nr:DUF192 domain-containing protein [Nanoarchaeota archaeon]